MFCRFCGNQLPEGVKFCAFCGKSLAPPKPADPVAEAPAEPIFTPVPPPVFPQPDMPTPVAPKKRKKTLVLWLLIPALMVGLAAGAYFGYTHYQADKDYTAAEKLLADGEYERALRAFDALDDFRDSDERADELEDLLDDYDKAFDLLEGGDYIAARELFDRLGSFRDSEEMAKYGVAYQHAKNLLAFNAMDYEFEAAIALLEDIPDYKDAKDLLSQAYLGLALNAIERNDMDSALDHAEHLNASDQQTFSIACKSSFADDEALEALRKGLVYRDELTTYGPSGTTYLDIVNAELFYIEEYRNASYADSNLQSYIVSYIDAVQKQYDSLSKDGLYIVDTVAWYEGLAIRCEILNALFDEYDFLRLSPELRSYFQGAEDYQWARVALEDVLSSQLWGIAPLEDSKGYYLELTNDSNYGFQVEFLQTYGNNGVQVGDTVSNVMEIPAGETVRVDLIFPDLEFTEWYIDWRINTIFDGDTVLKAPY